MLGQTRLVWVAAGVYSSRAESSRRRRSCGRRGVRTLGRQRL